MRTLLSLVFSSLLLGVSALAQNSMVPVDPTNPSHPLHENKSVHAAMQMALVITNFGAARAGLAEAGCALEYTGGRIFAAHCINSIHDDSSVNELHIQTDAHTIALFHTHGNEAPEIPSVGDRNPHITLPDFVLSRLSLYVVIPNTNHGGQLNNYVQLH